MRFAGLPAMLGHWSPELVERNAMNGRKLLTLIAIVALIAAFFAFDLGRYFTLDYFKSQQGAIDAFYAAHPAQTALAYFAAYVTLTALSFPGAAVMTLAAGAIFGLAWGTLIVSFASSIGATFAFLAARYLLRESIQQRFGDKLAAINAGIARDGAFYLFTLRLVPAFPFFAINLAMGLSSIRTWTYYWVSQLGMFAGTLVYVNAGTEIARIQSLHDIVSPRLAVSFALLGLFPLVAKYAITSWKRREIYAQWPRPGRFDRNMVVIGAGSAGLVTAYIAAAVKAKVTLVEQHRMGGDCLNTGCVPSKALIRSARFVADARRAGELGINAAQVKFDFGEIMERVQRIVARIEPHDSVARYTALGVECIHGSAKIVSPWAVEIDANGERRTLSTRNIVIAAGARPFVPPIPGLADIKPLTSDTVWSLRTLPRRQIGRAHV